jgi:hypothetical protein
MWDFIFDALETLFDWIGEIVSIIIEGVISMFDHVVQYFKGLRLRRHRDTPFIANENSQRFREMLHQAPVKNVGIFEGTYNEDTDEIENYRSLEADSLDPQIKQALGNEPLVVLN